MGKSKSSHADAVSKKVRKVNKAMPFRGDPLVLPQFPRDMKGKQKSWILAGLKHLKAPIAAHPEQRNYLSNDFLGYCNRDIVYTYKAGIQAIYIYAEYVRIYI